MAGTARIVSQSIHKNHFMSYNKASIQNRTKIVYDVQYIQIIQ